MENPNQVVSAVQSILRQILKEQEMMGSQIEYLAAELNTLSPKNPKHTIDGLYQASLKRAEFYKELLAKIDALTLPLEGK